MKIFYVLNFLIFFISLISFFNLFFPIEQKNSKLKKTFMNNGLLHTILQNTNHVYHFLCFTLRSTNQDLLCICLTFHTK